MSTTTTLAALLADVDLDELSTDGDTVDLADGSQIRLVIEPDEFTTVFDDGDWFGRLEWSRDRNDYGSTRPSGFTGRAQIIDRYRSSCLWWEPPTDVADVDSLRRSLRDLLEFGYVSIGLEWLGPEPQGYAVPRRSTIDTAWLSGVEAMHTAEYLSEIIGELAAELGVKTSEHR